MNYKELKDFCNLLDEGQLKEEVVLWREDEAINSIQAEPLSEDQYMRKDGEDEHCYPLSESEHPESELKLVHRKGRPILFENF